MPGRTLSTALPVILIGGYLGAGKTTLVNHLLRHAQGRRLAVLVNDFGEINIDVDLMQGRTAGVISLAGGCLCCSFGDDLVGTLQTLAQGDAPPDRVLIELSGVALPAPVARTISLARGVALQATVVLANAAAVQRQAADRYVGETVRQQLREADHVLLNKTDLASAGVLAALPAWLADLAPQACVMSCGAREIDPEQLLGWHARKAEPERALTAMANRRIGSGPKPAQTIFASHSSSLPADVDLAALGRALTAPGSGVLRAKALAQDALGQGRCLQVSDGHWQVDPAPAPDAARLVVIRLQQTPEAAA